jgi:ubiquinone/menaquinone biosynthesis C-methylase UbiE
MLDLARSRIRREKLGSRISLHKADACRTQLGGDTFDVVASNSILHHVADPAAFWQEVRRLCRPGGLVFVRDLFRPDSQARADRIVQTYAGQACELLQAEFHRSLLAAYTPEEIADQLGRAGLADLRVDLVTDRHVDVFGRVD